MSSKLSNVIGAPFDEYVLKQLYIRAAKNSTVNRTNDEVLFLANKTSWVRFVSSVNIVSETVPQTNTVSPTVNNNPTSFYTKLGLNPNDYPTPDSLAKSWILEAGTSTQNGNGITLRSGIGPDGAYGLGGTEELGYRPMPGLTSVTVETLGRLGSLRQATITFKVWNMNQLNVIEALYLRLGFSMLLEWGHTQYFENGNDNNSTTFITSGIYGIDNPFTSNYRKETVQHAITKKQKQTAGNYDGMLGIVSHFEWAFNQEGGYDCTVRLIGQGAIIDSMRINQNYTLPEGIAKQFKKNQSDIQRIIEENAQLKRQQEEDKIKKSAAAQPQPLLPPKNVDELYKYAQSLDNYLATSSSFKSTTAYYPAASVDPERTTTVPDYYYTSTTPNTGDRTVYDKQYFGLFLQGDGAYWKRLPLNYYFTLNKSLIDLTAKDSIDNKALQDAALTDVYYNVPAEIQNYSWVGKYFYVDLGTYTISNIGGSTLASTTTNIKVLPQSPLNTGTFSFNYLHKVGPTTNAKEKRFYINVSFNNPDANEYSVTRQQVAQALNNWFTTTPASLRLVDVQTNGSGVTSNLEVHATTTIEIPNATYVGTSKLAPSTRTVKVSFDFRFNNTMYIADIGSNVENVLANPQLATQANTGDKDSILNQATTPQVEAPDGYSSALEAMLVVIQTESQRYAIDKSDVVAVPIKATTEQFYNSGIMRGVMSTSTTPFKATEFNLQQYAAKGFNSSLIADPTVYESIPDVDFNKLCTSYVVKYKQSNLESTPSAPNYMVYIPLGYLLAFLNNMCLIYESTQAATPANNTTGDQKRPYVYIDFNPETNFCLTAPQQLSVDPTVCLIPFNATNSEYLEMYIPDIAKGLKNPFRPQVENKLTSILDGKNLLFKNPENAYQGKLMNVLLNTDYLLKLVRQCAGTDPEHAVNLQQFLERILVDVNKSLGNINFFRVAYRDESFTVQLVDDQWTPAMSKEKSILTRDQYLNNITTFYPNVKAQYGQLPVFGQQSLARQFQLKTNITTKMSSMIAISAQADTQSVNSKDHSEFSYLNQNFSDRYKPWVQDASNGSKGTNTNTKNQTNGESNDQKVATLFDTHIKSIYSTWDLATDKIDMAKTYYIERMSKVKSTNLTTTAAPFIPANLEVTIDGISGIVMGNAFTIPEDRLPISLRGSGGFTKVGFIVVGLTHTINQNQWLTRIRGQMINLKDGLKISATTVIKTPQITATVPTNTAVNLAALNLNQNWVNIAFDFITAPNFDSFQANSTFDVNHYRGGFGSDNFVTATGEVLTVTSSTVWTLADATRTLKYNIAGPYKDGVVKQIGQAKWDSLNDRQKATLISYAYNAGPGALTTWGIKRALEINAPATQVAQLIQTGPITAGGVVTPGLITRRKEEAKLYLS